MLRPTPEETRDADVPALEVVLADGQAWGLALPGPRLHPITRREVDPFGRPRVRIEAASRTGYPLEIWRLRDAAKLASEGAWPEFLDALRRLAVALLRLAHELEPEVAEALLDPRRVDLVGIACQFIPAAFGDASPPRTDGR